MCLYLQNIVNLATEIDIVLLPDTYKFEIINKSYIWYIWFIFIISFWYLIIITSRVKSLWLTCYGINIHVCCRGLLISMISNSWNCSSVFYFHIQCRPFFFFLISFSTPHQYILSLFFLFYQNLFLKPQ